MVRHQQCCVLQPNTWKNIFTIQQNKLQTSYCPINMKMKGVLKDSCTSESTRMAMFFRALYAWGLTLSMSSVFKYWTRAIDPLPHSWGNKSITRRQAGLMEKHVREGHFFYFAPQSRSLIQEGASLWLVIHPNMNLREGTTLPRGMRWGAGPKTHD